jgi:potassium efflux system protein
MIDRKKSVRLMTQVFFLLLVTTTIAGQPTPSKPLSDSEFAELLDARKKQIDVLGDLDDTAKSKIKDLYTQAQEEIKAAMRWSATTAQNEKLIADAPEELRQAKSALATQPSQPETIPTDASLAQIEQTISDREAELEKLRKVLADDEAAVNGGASRRTKISEQINAAKERLAGITERIQTPAAGDEKPAMTTARQTLLEAQKRTAEREVQCCEKELKAQVARAELLPQRRDLDARQVTLKEQAFKQWQDLANRRRKQEADQQAEKASWEASQAHPAVKRLMDDNTKLAEKRRTLAEDIAVCSGQLDQVNHKLTELKREYKSAQEKVDTVGLTNEIGEMLRIGREKLPSFREFARDISSRQQMIGQGQLDQLKYRDEQFALSESELDVRTKTELDNLDATLLTGNRAELERAIREALKMRREYLGALIGDFDIYYEKLVKLKNAEQELIDATDNYARYIDERVLWIASSSIFGTSDLQNLGKASWWLAGPNTWIGVGETLAADVSRNRTLWVFALAVFALLLYRRRRIRAMIEVIGQQAVRGSCCRFLPTMEASALTALMASAWPGLMWYIGWRLSSAGDLYKPFGLGLSETAKVFLALELFRNICRRGGLGEAHFGWSTSSLKLLRQNLQWFSLPVLPLMYVAVAMAWCNVSPHGDLNAALDAALGRLAFIAALLCFSLVLHRVFRPTSVICQTMIAERHGGWLDRFRYVWYPLIALTPVALAILAAVGYHYTSRQLVTRLILSTYVLVGGIVCRALLLRWTLVNQRKLAIEQARQRRAAAQCENVSGEDVVTDLPSATTPERDLATINIQTRRLIEYSLAVACSLVIWCAWCDVLPALNMLNQHVVWNANSAMDKIAEVDNSTKPTSEPTPSIVASTPSATTTLTYANGSRQFTKRPGDVTLADLFLAVIFFATTVIAAKNIPGLLEIAVLQHMPFDAGARYAVATVCRYVITIVGLSLCCSFLGIGWSKIQWLVAAMSLGLGFGLQEIFANFISGLIILFERPIRVGDVVTIDSITGVVSRIRMRATTITDGDRKELIIPNKEFITGRVLNWTLSDPINRVVIQVGVAYGTNTQRAAELLLKLAKDHPHILSDPPPGVALESFGDSALNFVLRCFLPNLDNRGTVIHDLHMGIDRVFREAGIEIAFPQHDVHVRSIEVPSAILQSAMAGGTPWKTAEKAA